MKVVVAWLGVGGSCVFHVEPHAIDVMGYVPCTFLKSTRAADSGGGGLKASTPTEAIEVGEGERLEVQVCLHYFYTSRGGNSGIWYSLRLRCSSQFLLARGQVGCVKGAMIWTASVSQRLSFGWLKPFGCRFPPTRLKYI